MSRRSLPLSPDRAALAEAIGARDQQRLAIDSATRAYAAAEEAVSAARVKHEAAEASVEAAKAAATAHAIDVAAGRPGEPPVTIRQARGALVDAEDVLASARAARDALAAALADAGKIDWVQGLVVAAAARVLAASPGVGRLVAEVEDLQRALAAKGSGLLWLARNDAIPVSEKGPLGRTGESTAAEIVAARLDRTPTSWTGLLADGSAATWKAALEALTEDAAAELP